MKLASQLIWNIHTVGGIMFGFSDIMLHLKGGCNMNRKMIALVLFVMIVSLCLVQSSYAADWSKFASGRNNIELQGYKSMPGYIEFQVDVVSI